MFDCSICGRIIASGVDVDSTLAEANRHVLASHGVNLLQYIKLAKKKDSGWFVQPMPNTYRACYNLNHGRLG